jgi:Na+-transporting methylmalonyl-CoA/oxaloacetate decarboxylase gamma subunit
MSHAVTNPFMIMFVNMSMVFLVLGGLSIVVRLVASIDPTKKTNARN